MRVAARKVNWSECPADIAPYTRESQTFLTVGREYEVHAVVVFKSSISLQVVDDLRYPAWEAAWLFNLLDKSVPDDWTCSVFEDEPILVLGPEFIAKDVVSYVAMVELEAQQVSRFWERIEARKREHE